MSINAVTFSDFLRKPKQVVKKVDREDVLLVRGCRWSPEPRPPAWCTSWG
jgi:hypothetical protein